MPEINPALIYNEDFIKLSDEYIPTTKRNMMVHSLISSCGLLDKLTLISPQPATFEDLAMFHTSDYLLFMKNIDQNCDEKVAEEFGFGYDCPLKTGIYEYCSIIAGGSLTAAKILTEGSHNVVFHWLGGWHHAKRNEAGGYCYVNDCVLAILHLRKFFPRVLYIDLDLHHGNGVEDAFCATDKVMTFSVHKHEAGFFPGSGHIDEIGFSKGRYYTVNLPLHDGIQDAAFVCACKTVLTKINEVYHPDAIVCQVGADGLNEDPMRSFNLTPQSLTQCIQQVLSWKLPTVILGGGGYNEANVARCWTQITADVLGITLPDEIPEHDFFPYYGPDFEFNIEKSLRKDLNKKLYLTDIVNTITTRLSKL